MSRGADNAGLQRGDPVYSSTLVAEMALFDSFPPRLRERLALATVDLGMKPIARALRRAEAQLGTASAVRWLCAEFIPSWERELAVRWPLEDAPAAALEDRAA